MPPEDIRNEFLAGRLSIARDLLPADAEAFRHDPRFASGYRESPRLTTYFVAFNAHRGPFQDAAARHALARGIRVDALVRRTLGRLAIPAHGLLPPGLLGYSAAGPSSDHRAPALARRPTARWKPPSRASRSTSPRPSIPSFSANSPISSRSLDEAFRDAGLRIRPVNKTMAEYLQHSDAGDVDLDVGRWTADYPDSDTFFFGALHSASGAFRRMVGNADIDRLSEQARIETDPRVRHSLYRQGEELIAREALMLPLFHDQVYCFARPELEGLTAIGQSNSTIAYEDLWIRR